MAGACGKLGERKDAYKVLVGGPEGKRQPGRPSRRLANNTKMYLQHIKWNHERN